MFNSRIHGPPAPCPHRLSADHHHVIFTSVSLLRTSMQISDCAFHHTVTKRGAEVTKWSWNPNWHSTRAYISQGHKSKHVCPIPIWDALWKERNRWEKEQELLSCLCMFVCIFYSSVLKVGSGDLQGPWEGSRGSSNFCWNFTTFFPNIFRIFWQIILSSFKKIFFCHFL